MSEAASGNGLCCNVFSFMWTNVRSMPLHGLEGSLSKLLLLLLYIVWIYILAEQATVALHVHQNNLIKFLNIVLPWQWSICSCVWSKHGLHQRPRCTKNTSPPVIQRWRCFRPWPDNVVLCKLCKLKIGYLSSTTALNKHLERKILEHIAKIGVTTRQHCLFCICPRPSVMQV